MKDKVNFPKPHTQYSKEVENRNTFSIKRKQFIKIFRYIKYNIEAMIFNNKRFLDFY